MSASKTSKGDGQKASDFGAFWLETTFDFATLDREGMYWDGSCWQQGKIDELNYNYYNSGVKTNRLRLVTDGAPSASKGEGFQQVNTNNYEYDFNGNLSYDPQKSLTIRYNFLNLPEEVTTNDCKSIGWLYDAAGNKLQKFIKNEAVPVSTHDYLGGIEYKNGVLEAIYHSEGRVYYEDGQSRYEYNITDHLGNTRLTFTDKNGNGRVDVTNDPVSNEILQENHYYPFGLQLNGPWNQNPGRDNKYTYNGKEFEEDFGLNWHYYGARMYDPAVARFTGVDPIADQFPWVNTYNYAENRPISGIDLWGLQYLDANLKIQMDKSSIKVSGRLDVNVKVVNFSSSSVTQSALNFHDDKSSRVFDNQNTLSFPSFIPRNPLTGERLGENRKIEANVDINFNFISVESNLDNIEKGDVVLMLVDGVDVPNDGQDEAGLADAGSGNVYMAEIGSFNRKTNIDSHEKGHLIGNLSDMKGSNAPFGFLMSYNNNGKGYKLKFSERKEIINNIIDNAALGNYGQGWKNNDTKTIAQDLFRRYGQGKR